MLAYFLWVSETRRREGIICGRRQGRLSFSCRGPVYGELGDRGYRMMSALGGKGEVFACVRKANLACGRATRFVLVPRSLPPVLWFVHAQGRTNDVR